MGTQRGDVTAEVGGHEINRKIPGAAIFLLFKNRI